MVIKTQDYIYILEFKLDKSADDALQQIKDKQYAKPFEQDGRKIYEIGINFSTSTKRIESWKIWIFRNNPGLLWNKAGLLENKAALLDTKGYFIFDTASHFQCVTHV